MAAMVVLWMAREGGRERKGSRRQKVGNNKTAFEQVVQTIRAGAHQSKKPERTTML